MTMQLPTSRLTRHLLYWTGTLLFYGLITIVNPHFCFCDLVYFLRGLFFSFLPIILIHTYVLAYGILPLVFRRQFGWFVGGLLLLNLFSWFLHDLLFYIFQLYTMDWFSQKSPEKVNTWLFNSTFPGGNFYDYNLIAGLFICLKLFSQWQQKKAESQQLEREKLQTELKLLKLQLNPAFLFGSLTTLHHLAQNKSTQAPEVMLKLAHFLRYVLYESQVERVPLVWEVEVIEQFIFLQRAMHPTGLDVSLSVRGEMDNQTIAPLSLFPIVEQTFHHLHIDPSEPAWVSIDLAIDETKLALKVINEQTIGQPDNTIWLADVEKQLHFCYGQAFTLLVWTEADIRIISLTLPFYYNTATSRLRNRILAWKRAN